MTTASALLEHPAERVAVPVIDPASPAAPRRGGDVRVFDRRDMREVGGPGHPFATPGDILVTNGLFRFWVGSRGLTPYLTVSARSGGVWREAGCIQLADPAGADTLVAGRLVALTPERAVVALSVRNQGTVHVRLHRGERMVRITHGSRRAPAALVLRSARWSGAPPAPILSGSVTTGGRFAGGWVPGSGGACSFRWPPVVRPSSWSTSAWWTPNAAASALGYSALMAIEDLTGAVVGRVFMDTDHRVKFTLGANTLQSDVQTFPASSALSIVPRFSTTQGMGLTVTVAGSAAQQYANPAAVDPGAAGAYARIDLSVAATGTTTPYGTGSFGTGIYGGAVPSGASNGPIDNLMIFIDRLSDLEAAALGTAAVALGNLPTPEARLVWYAPFDAALTPTAGESSPGIVGETVADSNGFLRFVAALRGGTPLADSFGLSTNAASWDVAAGLGIWDWGETVFDHRCQFSSSTSQEILVR